MLSEKVQEGDLPDDEEVDLEIYREEKEGENVLGALGHHLGCERGIFLRLISWGGS